MTDTPGSALPVEAPTLDAAAEYRAAREAAAIAVRGDLAHLRLYGRDPVRMVQGLITTDLAGAPLDRVVYGVMLTPKGRVIADLRAAVVEAEKGREVHLDLPREVHAEAAEHLRRSLPPMYARWEDVSESVGTVGVYGPRSRELVERVLGAPAAAMEEDQRLDLSFEGDGVRVVGVREFGGLEGYDLTAAASVSTRLVERLTEEGAALGALRVGRGTLETLRVEAGRPRGGHELTGETIPTEAFESIGLMERGISFSKGCYTGQEVIVRIAHRGHVNRHLRGLRLPVAGIEAGTRLVVAETGKDVGWVTSVADSPLVGGPIALAFVRREIEPGAAVRLGAEGPEATVTTLPFGREQRGG